VLEAYSSSSTLFLKFEIIWRYLKELNRKPKSLQLKKKKKTKIDLKLEVSSKPERKERFEFRWELLRSAKRWVTVLPALTSWLLSGVEVSENRPSPSSSFK
jgi:hypothetical protein